MSASDDIQILSVTEAAWPAWAAALLRIEEQTIPNPWSAELFLSDLRDPDCTLYALVTPLTEGRVLGFCATRRCYDEVHILQIAIDPQVQQKGHGGRLLAHVINRAQKSPTPIGRFILEVRRSNEAALRLYRKYGFRLAGTRRAYYKDGEDALVMICPLGEVPDIR